MTNSGSSITSSDIRQIARGVAREEASKVKTEINSRINEINSRINEIMRDIDQMSRELQRSIETQTTAIIAGVAATTAAVVSTKSEVSQTREQLSDNLSLQLKSELQLELGRKLNIARSASTKFKRFYQDIKSRFDKSVQGVFINRSEYNVRFEQIFEEYEKKIRTIGEHIFQIRDEIRLVEASSSSSLESIHKLPLEVDLYRLELRSEELDQTVQLLEVSRLQEIKEALTNLKEKSEQLCFSNIATGQGSLGLEATVLTSSNNSTDLLVGAVAERINGGSVSVNTRILQDESNGLSTGLSELIEAGLSAKERRDLSDSEYLELQAAVETLSKDGIISPDDAAFAEALIDTKNIRTFS